MTEERKKKRVKYSIFAGKPANIKILILYLRMPVHHNQLTRLTRRSKEATWTITVVSTDTNTAVLAGRSTYNANFCKKKTNKKIVTRKFMVICRVCLVTRTVLKDYIIMATSMYYFTYSKKGTFILGLLWASANISRNDVARQWTLNHTVVGKIAPPWSMCCLIKVYYDILSNCFFVSHFKQVL